MSNVTVKCDRCKAYVNGMETKSATGGFYKVGAGTAWAKFANEGESIVCDACMFDDPRYIAIYGKHAS